jgi:electron transfer flavoprotein alpha subunit
MAKILVVAQSQGDALDRATLSAVTMARQASTIQGGGFDILVLGGPGSASVADDLAGYGAENVLLVEDDDLSPYVGERFVNTVASAARDYFLLVATATSYGKDLLPRVAGCLDAAYAGDCSGVTSHDGALSFRRPTFAGNVLGVVTLTTRIQVATARQCEFEAAVPAGSRSPIQALPFVAPGLAASRVEIVSQSVAKDDRRRLTEAKIIVSGGRALKDDFFAILDPLADALGAAIGATRIACNSGYAPSGIQVGQSGKIVAPRVYFAIGLSGSIQHIAGMRGSKVIVAINRDPQAPIFQLADYGLVADLFETVPEIVLYMESRARLIPTRISA